MNNIENPKKDTSGLFERLEPLDETRKQKLRDYLAFLVNRKNRLRSELNSCVEKMKDLSKNLNIMHDNPPNYFIDTMRQYNAELTELINKSDDLAKQVKTTINGTHGSIQVAHIGYSEEDIKTLTKNKYFIQPIDKQFQEQIEALYNRREFEDLFISKRTIDSELPLYAEYEDNLATVQQELDVSGIDYSVSGRISYKGEENKTPRFDQYMFETYEKALEYFNRNRKFIPK